LSDVILVDENNFQAEVTESNLPVLVDFWAPWCMPCRQVSPLIDKVAEIYKGRLKVCKLNTEENMTLALKEEITIVPTFKVYLRGKVVLEKTGNMPEQELITLIDKAINSKE